MATLTAQKIKNSYKDLIQVSNSNAGIDATIRYVEDGEGTASVLGLSTTGVTVNGTFKIATGTVASGGAHTWTFPAFSGTVSTIAGTETLTNKTITSPVIATIVNSGTLTLPTSTDTLVGRATTDTLTNKTLTAPVIATITNTGTLTLPTSTDTLVGKATTDTLTNKTLTSPTINTPTITVPVITGGGSWASPTLTGAVISGAGITTSTYNGMSVTATTGTLTLTNAKTLAATNSVTLTGTDASTIQFKTGGYVVYDADTTDTWTSFTPAWTGFVSNAIGATAFYKKIGKICHIAVVSGQSGTSNASTFTMTGLPFTSGANITTWFKVMGANASAGIATAEGSIVPSSTTVVFSIQLNASGWTASGGKYVMFTCTYETA